MDAATIADRRRVQQAAVRTGLWVGAASAGVVAIVTIVIVSVVLATARPERRPPHGFDGDGPGGPQVVDVDDVVPVAIAVGLLGVVLLGLIAWYVSRRAAQPLADALEVQRRFVADASHELRTPLTTLTARIQLAQHRVDRGGDVDAVLAQLRHDAAVMDAVLTDLLVSAESAGARPQDASATVSVAEAARDAIRVIEPRASERGVTLVAEALPALHAGAEATSLTRALVALLDNAVRYSPPGSVIAVRARRAGRRIEVRVSDQGTGITGIDPEHLFERFARSDAPEADGRRGFGLGLALVSDIATRFGGSVRVESTSGDGTTFLLELPDAAHA
ncbi:sensor histidine kinase [Microbacterium kyungheense]|uniref:sensor histidine kinase n=1 Tax=Microbacterium kyungheense TaxID=1263636 RepID=UPI001FEB712A|nr:HAMP domain-containing sensor histidine kinase [Microbacterium kyungheense]